MARLEIAPPRRSPPRAFAHGSTLAIRRGEQTDLRTLRRRCAHLGVRRRRLRWPGRARPS